MRPMCKIFAAALLALWVQWSAGGHAWSAAPAAAAPTAARAWPARIEQVACDARSAGKLLLLDFQASWCATCRIMAETTLADPAVHRALRDRYRVLAVDIDVDPGLARAMEVEELPTQVVVAPGRQEISRRVGYVDAAGMRRFLARAEAVGRLRPAAAACSGARSTRGGD